MSGEPGPDTGPRFDVQPSVSNHFAWLRTRLGIERTFMAWLRTSVSLIGFGFTIVQFFQHLKSTGIEGVHAMRPQAPRDLGLALIGTGVMTLAISTWQYREGIRYLWQDQFRAIAGTFEKPHRTPLFATAIVLALIGLYAFAAVFFHIM
jgi:putative membrane protein